MRSLSLLPGQQSPFSSPSSFSCATNFLVEISSLSPPVEFGLKCVSDSGATWCRNPGETPDEAEGDRERSWTRTVVDR